MRGSGRGEKEKLARKPHDFEIANFVWPWKMVSVSVRYLSYQSMDEKIKTWTLRFPAKENPYMEKALFDCPIVLQYDVEAKYRLISRKFSGMNCFHTSVHLTNQKLHTFVRSIRWTNQIALFPLVCCFCFFRAFLFQGHTKIALNCVRPRTQLLIGAVLMVLIK